MSNVKNRRLLTETVCRIVLETFGYTYDPNAESHRRAVMICEQAFREAVELLGRR